MDSQREARFDFVNAENTGTVREISDAIRVITHVRVASGDYSRMSLAVSGTSEQIGEAEWLVGQLDRPATGLSGFGSDYPAAGGQRIRIIPIHNLNGVELSGVVRDIGEIGRAASCPSAKAIIVRDAPDRLRLAQWLVSELDRSSATTRSEFQVAAGDVMAVYRLANARSAADVQDVAWALGMANSRALGLKISSFLPEKPSSCVHMTIAWL